MGIINVEQASPRDVEEIKAGLTGKVNTSQWIKNTDANTLSERDIYFGHGYEIDNAPDAAAYTIINLPYSASDPNDYGSQIALCVTDPKRKPKYRSKNNNVWTDWMAFEPAYEEISINDCATIAEIVAIMTANKSKIGFGNVGFLNPASNLKTLLGNPPGFGNYTRIHAKFVSGKILHLYAIGLSAGMRKRAEAYITNNDSEWTWEGWRDLDTLSNLTTLANINIMDGRDISVSGGYCKTGNMVVLTFTIKSNTFTYGTATSLLKNIPKPNFLTDNLVVLCKNVTLNTTFNGVIGGGSSSAYFYAPIAAGETIECSCAYVCVN